MNEYVLILFLFIVVDVINGFFFWEIFVFYFVEFVCIGVGREELVVVVVLFEVDEFLDV